MRTEVVRNVFVELRSMGPSLGGGIWRAPLGKIEKWKWKMGRMCGRDVVEDHVGHEDPEGEGGQGQVEAAETQGRQGDESPDHRGHDDGEEEAPQRDPLIHAGTRETQVEHDDGGDGAERDRGQVDLTGVAGEQGE